MDNILTDTSSSLLDGVPQEGAAVGLLDGIGEDAAQITPPNTLDFSARIAGVAQTDVTSDLDQTLAMIDANTKTANEIMQNGQEMSMRYQMAGKQQVEAIKGLKDLASVNGLDPDTQNAVAAATEAVYNEDVNYRARVAMEKQAIANIQLLAARDPVQAKLQLNLIEMGSPQQVIRDAEEKKLILGQAIAKAEAEYEDQSWLATVVDFILPLIPFNQSFGDVGNVNIDDNLKGWFDGIFSGSRIVNENSALNNMSVEDYAKNIDTVVEAVRNNATTIGYRSNMRQLELLRQLSNFNENDRAWKGVLNTLDVGFAGQLVGAGRLLSIPRVLAASGARKEAGNAVAEAAAMFAREGSEAAAKKTGITAEEVVDNLSVTAINPNGGATTVPLAMDAASTLERAEKLVADLIPNTHTQARMSSGEQSAAQAALVKEVEASFGRATKDVSFGKNVTTSGETTFAEFTFGKADGKPFLTEAAAKAAAGTLGHSGAEVVGKAGTVVATPIVTDTGKAALLGGTTSSKPVLVNIVQDEAGGFYFKVRKDMPEAGFYTDELAPQGTNQLIRKLGSTSENLDRGTSDAVQQAGNTRSRLQKSLQADFSSKFKGLGKASRDDLAQIIKAGENEGTWFNNSQLDILFERQRGTLATAEEKAAYHAARDANDIEWILRNDELYTKKITQGFETVELGNAKTGTLKIDGFVNEALGEVPKTRVYNISDDVHYTREGRALTEEELARYKAKGYVLVKTEQPINIVDGTTVDQFLIKKTEITRNPLDRINVGYRAGGHRIYTDKYFVKQAAEGVQSDTLKKFLKSPSTFASGASKAEVQGAVDVLEQARLAIIDNPSITGAELDALVFKDNPLFIDGEKFVNLVKEKKISTDHPFETVYDRELPSLYNQSKDDISNFVDFEEAGWTANMRSQGRMYYSGKGEHLPDIKGGLAPTLDPYKTISQSLYNVANLSSFSDFKLSQLERFVNSFKAHLQIGDLKGSANIFANAAIKPGTDLRLVNKIEAQREALKRILSYETPIQKAARQQARQTAEWITGSGTNAVRNKAADAFNWVASGDPVKSLRGIAFDATLGLWNIGQLPIQMSTAFVASFMSPKYGAKAAVSWLPMRAWLYKSGREDVLDVLAQRGMGKQMGFESVDEFKDYARAVRDSGFLEVGNSHLSDNSFGMAQSFSITGGKGQAVREAGRWAFYEAEKVNRWTAYRIAWGKTLEEGVARTDPKFLQTVAGKANDYSFRMTGESAAYWQKGLWSIPTQFWGYSARNVELMLGKSFSGEEKVRMLMASTILGGAAALPFASAAIGSYNKSQGSVQQLGDPIAWLTRGALDNIIYEMTGADIKAGAKFGTQDIWVNIYKDIFGMSEYGEKSTADVLGGATASIVGKGLTTLAGVAKYAAAESGGDAPGYELTKDNLKEFAESINSVNYGLKAWMAWKYNTIQTGGGRDINTDVPSSAAFFYALGFQPGEKDEMGAILGFQKNKKEAIQDATNVLSNYRQELLKLDANSETYDQDQAKLLAKVNTFVKLLPDDIAKEARKRANRGIPQPLLEGLRDKMNEERIKAGEEPVNYGEQPDG